MVAARYRVSRRAGTSVCEQELERTDSGKAVSVSFLQGVPVAVFENELVLLLAFACLS